MNNELATELKLLGLQPTREQIKRIQNIAIKQHRKEQCAPIFKEDKWYHYIVLLMAFTRANNELCYFISENSINRTLKRDFKQLKRLTRSVHEEFEKHNAHNELLMNAYKSYSDDLTEMLYIHLDSINRKEQ